MEYQPPLALSSWLFVLGTTQQRGPFGVFLHIKGFPGGSVVRNLPAVQETSVQALGREDPLDEGMATHSSPLAWRTPWTEESGKQLHHNTASNLKIRTLRQTPSISLPICTHLQSLQTTDKNGKQRHCSCRQVLAGFCKINYQYNNQFYSYLWHIIMTHICVSSLLLELTSPLT